MTSIVALLALLVVCPLAAANVASSSPAPIRGLARLSNKLGAASKRLSGARGEFASQSALRQLRRENTAALALLAQLSDESDPRWASVVGVGRCRVWRLREPASTASRHTCLLAKGLLRAEPAAVYDLLRDARRASEFNEFCAECVDVESVDRETKISWSVTKKIGIFKPRDFVTACHFCRGLGANPHARVVVNHAVTHALRPPVARFRRAEVLIGGYVVQPVAGDPGASHLTMLARINPRGAVDSKLGAAVANRIALRSPPALFDAIEKAAQP